jgi:hypothetical protein
MTGVVDLSLGVLGWLLIAMLVSAEIVGERQRADIRARRARLAKELLERVSHADSISGQ